MKRIFGDFAYGPGPREGCWWDETCDVPEGVRLEGDLSVDVAVVGGGLTGLTAARRLAQNGVRVALLEAKNFGWGASGRNGGFCCLGGGMAQDADLEARFGRSERLAFRRAEKDAVDFVEAFISTYGLDVDLHSQGETQLAHRKRDMEAFFDEVELVLENYGVEPQFIAEEDLQEHGMTGGAFHGAMTIPIGFGLNPRKYLAGLVRIAYHAGALLYDNSPVLKTVFENGRHILTCDLGRVKADQVVFATNGYTSENVPHWMAGRYMPSQSTVIVTRPLEDREIRAQGWSSDQMCYDTRNLLHYFRLMPDRRFLFGMRGSLLTGERAEASARRRVREDFENMFPQWAHVESAHAWSGLVCLARRQIPFIGKLPEAKGTWGAMCFHGNGVAMGSYAGCMVADMVLGRDSAIYPDIVKTPLERFPLGVARRVLMPPLYVLKKLQDGR